VRLLGPAGFIFMAF